MMDSIINNGQICFTKKDLRSNFSVISNTFTTSNKFASTNMQISTNAHIPSATLDSRIQRALKQEKLLQLKKGLYMTSTGYIHELDKVKLAEYISSQIYQPSYISLEYALKKHGLLSQSAESCDHPVDPSSNLFLPITAITTKSTRTFKNFSGTYRYSNIKSSLYIGNNHTHDDETIKTENNNYIGYKEHTFHGHTYHMATKAKAMFDYLYLNSALNRRDIKQLRHQLFEESGIHWENFSENDFKEFDSYVWNSKSKKMMTVLRVINDYFENKKFDAWKKELLG